MAIVLQTAAVASVAELPVEDPQLPQHRHLQRSQRLQSVERQLRVGSGRKVVRKDAVVPTGETITQLGLRVVTLWLRRQSLCRRLPMLFTIPAS